MYEYDVVVKSSRSLSHLLMSASTVSLTWLVQNLISLWVAEDALYNELL